MQHVVCDHPCCLGVCIDGKKRPSARSLPAACTLLANTQVCIEPLYCRYKCKTTRGRDGHGYNTRGRDELRAAQYRLRAYGALPRGVGSKLINLLPLGIREKHR
ncbi:hypothetical protein J6590_025819 [Homalodisca vitripennis]|nr:hypothetical protein J6590_025819 [Homalodisca vitripennis]